MAHFAELDENNIVIRVIVVNDENCKDQDGNENEAVGQAWLKQYLGGTWVQTSYNHKIRGNFAGPGFHYLEKEDRFVPPKPFSSWQLNKETWIWEAPVPNPDDTLNYQWSEDKQEWILSITR